LTEVKGNTVFFMNGLYASRDFSAHYALEWMLFRCDHVDSDTARAERCGNFKPDEARADHDRAFCGFCLIHNRAAIGKGAKVEHVRCIRTGYRDMDRFGARGNQQCSIFPARSVFE
jgi:hypothetical protein